MESVVRAAQGFFWHENVKFERTEPTGVFRSGFIGRNGCFLGYVEVDEGKRTVHIQTLAPLVVSKGKRLETAELVTRINQYLALGTLELDMDSGTIACRTSIVLGESDLHHDIMEHLLYANWHVMDRFFPAINAVIFGNVSPSQAIGRTRCRQLQPEEITPDERLGKRLRDILGGSMN